MVSLISGRRVLMYQRLCGVAKGFVEGNSYSLSRLRQVSCVTRVSRLPSPGINCCLVEGCQEILSLDLPGCYVTDCPCGSPIETLLLYCPAPCCCLGCHSKPACSCVIKTNLLRKSSHLLFFVATPYHLLTSLSTRLDQHLSGLLTPLIT